MKLKNILALTAWVFPLAAAAQTICFEEQDYKSLGIYDTWTESPFRTGILKGHYAVVDNHLQEVSEELGMAPNASTKMLAVQRSRFGSNTFGVRIDLNETFELTTKTRYIHVMVNRPYNGRIMVVGLGKRRDRSGQSPETEQFWAMSTGNVTANRWEDVVLPIKGNSGIDIYSLVVVPDCESPHAYTQDGACYIDNIAIDESPMPRFTYEYYPINFDRTKVNTRDDRYVKGIQLEGSADGTQKVNVDLTQRMFYTHVATQTFCAKAGDKVTLKLDYKGNWMNGYVYLDVDDNGRFAPTLNANGTPAKGSDVMAYSYCNGKNSKGTAVSNGNVLSVPSFTVPALQPGYYRMRCKVDWDNIDPAGSVVDKNALTDNGGGIVDIRLNIHGDECNVNDANRNGEVLAADGKKLVKYKAPFGQPFTVKMNPEKGFEYAGIVIKHGYNLSGDSVSHDNIQWEKVRIERRFFNDKDEYTIPAKYMDGDVEIEGLFIENGKYVDPVITSRYKTTTIQNGEFADTTTWYTLQIGKDGWVLANNGKDQFIALNNKSCDPKSPKQLWCFTGNDTDGFQLYNREAGPGKVLAASVNMSASDGGNNFPVLYAKDAIPYGYVSVWRFANSTDLGAGGKEYAYMYQDGYEQHKVNNRNGKLAFWTGGQDAGSTLRVRFAMKDVPSGIGDYVMDAREPEAYDLNGRRVEVAEHGIYVINGNAVYCK